MSIGSYPGCCRFFTGMSSGGTSSRLSESFRSGSDDGSNIRCMFHGGATSSLADGIICAFADDVRPSKIAAAGAGTVFRPDRRRAFAERDARAALHSRPAVKMQMHISSLVLYGKRPAPARPCRCIDLLPKNILSAHKGASLGVVQIVFSVAEHCVVRSEGLFLDCNASDAKKFSALQKNFHRIKTTLWRRVVAICIAASMPASNISRSQIICEIRQK
jgi:hypothetical protein